MSKEPIPLLISNWCVECSPGKLEGAKFIYRGNSLCEKHFLIKKVQIMKEQNDQSNVR